MYTCHCEAEQWCPANGGGYTSEVSFNRGLPAVSHYLLYMLCVLMLTDIVTSCVQVQCCLLIVCATLCWSYINVWFHFWSFSAEAPSNGGNHHPTALAEL